MKYKDRGNERAILFLRPFWEDTDATVAHLKAIHNSTKSFGKLVAFQNGPERENLRLLGDRNPWAKYGSIWEKIYDYINPSLNLQLIQAPRETWQEQIIKQIQIADVVIVHLAPKEGPNVRKFDAMRPSQTPSPDYFGHNPVHEVGTGYGLLRELDYCRRANALEKVIVLIPNSFFPRVLDALKILKMTQTGQYFRKTKEGLVALTSKLSARDHALAILGKTHSIISYRHFGGAIFNFYVQQALKSLIQQSHPQHLSSLAMAINIPPKPVALPPDGKLKRIRFTPIKRLTKLPRGKIVELSLDEVKLIFPDVASEPLECPNCHEGPQFMFWYQYGLEPNFSREPSVYMRCQYCGHDDYL